MPDCSVVICSLNPSHEHLSRVVAALRDQTLPQSKWELVLIDNRSTPPIESWIDLSWHPAARCLREDQPGLLAARIRGVRETTGPVVVFVDDDNILAPDYLEQALRVAHQHPRVAVWSGQSFPEFESPPPDWTRPWWSLLAITSFSEDEIPDPWISGRMLPHGAGMCARRTCLEHYISTFHHHPARALLGRKGSSLMSAEDHDIALSAYEQGYVTGRFTALSLTHILRADRLTADYLLKLMTSMAASREVLAVLHPGLCVLPRTSIPHWLRVVRHFLRLPGFNRSYRLAILRGEKQGRRMLSDLAPLPS